METSLRLVSPIERALHLKRLTALRQLGPVELGTVAQRANEQFYRKGAKLSNAGEPVKSLHIILEGRVEVHGPEHGDTTLGQNEVLGLLSVLSRDERGLDAEALADTSTLELRADQLMDVFEDSFTILHSQMRELALLTLNERRQIADGTYLAPYAGQQPTSGDKFDLVERLLRARQGILAQSNLDALIELMSKAEEVEFESGTTLWKRGDPSGFIYSIITGRVRCTLEDGTRFFAGPGYPLGNLESQCDSERWYEAVTEEHVRALYNNTSVFIDILEQHFEMAIEFLAIMARGLLQRLEEKRQQSPA